MFCSILFCFREEERKVITSSQGEEEGFEHPSKPGWGRKKKENAGDAGTETLILRRSRTQSKEAQEALGEGKVPE